MEDMNQLLSPLEDQVWYETHWSQWKDSQWFQHRWQYSATLNYKQSLAFEIPQLEL